MAIPGRNRLSQSASPYLLQHAANPVHWWEWGPEPFAAAAERDVPVLLSVGYASCHWCHVMAHESFEDEATADVMNTGFVCVKVDREERPDVDRIYMDAVQAMTGQGGWPMTVFLTPQAEPFYAGTYFPPEDRGHHPSFRKVMAAVADAWQERRDEVIAQAGTLAAAVARPMSAALLPPGGKLFEEAYRAIAAAHDPINGGFGGAPKFPQAPTLEFLLRAARKPWAPEAKRILERTLTAMADGGIHDQVGGGFARYAVDERWLVPHFEKMLYDNALLIRLYARAWQVTGNDRFATVARSTIDYLLRDLRLPEGGFASGEDADSDGVEGRFYVFTGAEVAEAAGADAEIVATVWGVTDTGNFEGANILHHHRPLADVASEMELTIGDVESALGRVRTALGELRSRRARPGLDDKAVAAWNGMAVRALAEAGMALDDPTYVSAAVDAARFIADHLVVEGRLMRSWRQGAISVTGFCDDVAAVALGWFAVYQATGDAAWYGMARNLTLEMVERFWDPEVGGFFATADDAETLIARPKNLFDNPTPSDNALAAEALQTLAALSGNSALAEQVDAVLLFGGTLMDRYPAGAGQMLSVALVAAAPPRELAIVGPEPGRRLLLEAAHADFLADVFVAHGDDSGEVPLLAGRDPVDGDAAAYLCRGFVCEAPTTDPAGLLMALRE